MIGRGALTYLRSSRDALTSVRDGMDADISDEWLGCSML
jgi:hypothetical protein